MRPSASADGGGSRAEGVTIGGPRRGWLQATLAILTLLVVAGALSHDRYGGGIGWTKDGLFLEARTLQITQGVSEHAALEQVFFVNPLPRRLAEREALLGPGKRRAADPRWVDYSAQFYRRRWLVPALAAATYPSGDAHGLETVSLVGYLLLGPLLFLLLRRRFSVAASLAVAAACILLEPVRDWSFRPLTESWGLALEIGSLLAAALVLERGLRWLPAWIACMVLLSVTRDATIVLVAATAIVALADRSRTTLVLFASGLVAAVPAPLLFGAPLLDQLAYAANGFYIPQSTSIGSVAGDYLPALGRVLEGNFDYALHNPLTAAVFLGGMGLLLFLSPRGDPFFRLARWSLLGCALLLAIALNPTNFRLELVLVPLVAVGLALGCERAAGAMRALRPRARANEAT